MLSSKMADFQLYPDILRSKKRRCKGSIVDLDGVSNDLSSGDEEAEVVTSATVAQVGKF